MVWASFVPWGFPQRVAIESAVNRDEARRARYSQIASDHPDELALSIGIAVDITLGRLDRSCPANSCTSRSDRRSDARAGPRGYEGPGGPNGTSTLLGRWLDTLALNQLTILDRRHWSAAFGSDTGPTKVPVVSRQWLRGVAEIGGMSQ